jgi:glutathione S-transferase
LKNDPQDPPGSDTLILHQYAASPFAEKARLMLGFKGLAWRGVDIPVVMPKPDLVALTGGYRRTPVLQIGADIHCDTAHIARVLERLRPAPTLYPASAPLAEPLAQWADFTLFWPAVIVGGQPAAAPYHFPGAPPEAFQAFAGDRAAFTSGMKRPSLAESRVQLERHGGALERQLADGRAFLLGAEASIADFAVAHGLWFIRRAGPLAGVLAPWPRLGAWLDRVLAFGHGRRGADLAGAEALAVAAAARAHAPAAVQPGHGFEAGAPVTVCAADYGSDLVAGTLVGLDELEIVLSREDARAGTVHVHFPRAGFQLRANKDIKA